ncbi:hypothetical protein VCHENC02_3628A, partial [Vibrio harveyi]
MNNFTIDYTRKSYDIIR